MDRWNIVTTLNYLPHEQEVDIVTAKCPKYNSEEGQKLDLNKQQTTIIKY